MKHPVIFSCARALMMTAVVALTGGPAWAQSPTGTLTGRVTDASTRLALAGAHVTVPGTALETYTDQYGSYTLDEVPAGLHTVEVGYVGYAPLTGSAEVAGLTHLDFAFNRDVVHLEKFVIQGSAVGTARALNQQRAADTLTNVVASDEIGEFPDQNAAEALQRVPGLSLYRDQGEGRYIIVRGVNYGFNSITLNGAKLASPEEGGRGLALDVVPADALSSIEVFKVATPDMDAEGLGGRVNINTKSPFDTGPLDASLNVESIYSHLADAFGYKVNGTVSALTADGTLGVLVSPSYQKRKFGSYNFEEDGYSLVTSPSTGQPVYVLDAVNFRDYQIERTRSGVTAALEGRPAEQTHLYLRGTFHRFVDHEYRNRSVFDFTEGTLTAADDTAAEFNRMRRWRRDVRLRHKIQELSALTAGGETRFGDWRVDGQVAWSKGHEENPDEASVRFRHDTRDGTFRYTTAGAYAITLEQLAGGDMADPSTYNFQRIDYSNDSGDETEFDAAFNARLDLATAAPAYVKFGAAYRAKDKRVDDEAFELTGAPTGFTYASLSGGLSDYPYLAVPRIDGDRASAAFYPNISAFASERVFDDSELGDWKTTEDVYAAYAMGSVKLGATTLIAGSRVERTETDFTGKSADIANEVVLGTTRVSRRYTNWLPGLYLRHDFNKHVVLRASWSHSIARPEFENTAAYLGINDDDKEITAGNPYLDTLESTNWDASIDYYLPALGVLSAGVFYKQIDNFNYEITLDAATNGYPDYAGYDLITYRNGSDGNIRGLELSYQQQLRFLPAPFDGLGVLANVTFTDSSATYPTRPGEDLPFIGNSKRVGNVGLSYEKAGFFARLAVNFRSPRLREDEPVGADAAGDRYVDNFHQLDLTLRYRLNKHWEIFAEGVNLTNEPFRVYFNSPGTTQGKRLVQFEEYGWGANLGVRWRM